MVTCNGYRPPSLLAKMASCVDVMSRGRLILGIGAGWYEHEYQAYGYEYPETPERLRMLREALQVIKAMWTQERAQFAGSYYNLRAAINEPKPVQKPHPPIWIGGAGEKVTLKLVAQYGDACNFNADVETVRHKLNVLREHCESVGRDYDSVLKTIEFYTILGDEKRSTGWWPTRRGVPGRTNRSSAPGTRCPATRSASLRSSASTPSWASSTSS
jgi:alkanesulfonate monooxygenase SsuD/methylene tetrahydromethanopterin reductase-like flavin-dependent oxidoreductase (luciferase family)